MTMPTVNDTFLGGHAVVLVGYDDTKRMFFCRNSWGIDWGLEGYFWMPYEFALNGMYTSDFWILLKK